MIIAVDFDGTLCGEANFPEIGEPFLDRITALKYYKTVNKDKLILWTCREGEYLDQAVEWCKKYQLEFDSVNENLPELKDNIFGKRKVIADVYLDDKSAKVSDINNLHIFKRGL